MLYMREVGRDHPVTGGERFLLGKTKRSVPTFLPCVGGAQVRMVLA